jgi:hypothetical protein
MTKKQIIEKLRQAKVATLAFNGLVSTADVDKERDLIVKGWTVAVDQWNAENPNDTYTLEVDEKKVSAGPHFRFLPAYPKTGPVQVRSRDYIVAGVYCDQSAILPDTYAETDKTWAFQTKAGSCVLVAK